MEKTMNKKSVKINENLKEDVLQISNSKIKLQF